MTKAKWRPVATDPEPGLRKLREVASKRANLAAKPLQPFLSLLPLDIVPLIFKGEFLRVFPDSRKHYIQNYTNLHPFYINQSESC